MRSDHIRRSVRLDGRGNTSLSVEASFWRELRRIAAAEKRTLPQIIRGIRREGVSENLSRAVRIFVLDRIVEENEELRRRAANN